MGVSGSDIMEDRFILYGTSSVGCSVGMAPMTGGNNGAVVKEKVYSSIPGPSAVPSPSPSRLLADVSVTSVVMVSVYVSSLARSASGVKKTVFVAILVVTCPATLPPVESLRYTELPSTVAIFRGSLKMTLTWMSMATLSSSLAGVDAVALGGVVSTRGPTA